MRNKLVSIAILAGLGLWALSRPLSLPPSFDIYKSGFRLSDSYIFSSDGRLLNRLRHDFTKRNIVWTDADQLRAGFTEKLVAREDKRFFRHFGVDPAALVSAAFDTLAGHPRGASTLSMQLAKHYYSSNNN